MLENVTYFIPSNSRRKLFSVLQEHSIMVAHNSAAPVQIDGASIPAQE